MLLQVHSAVASHGKGVGLGYQGLDPMHFVDADLVAVAGSSLLSCTCLLSLRIVLWTMYAQQKIAVERVDSTASIAGLTLGPEAQLDHCRDFLTCQERNKL